MELSPLAAKLVLAHAAIGGHALGAGLFALFARKGGRAHVVAGWIFVVGMLLALLLAVPAIVERRNLLLGLVGPFTAWMVLRGFRVFRVLARGEGPLDRLLSWVPKLAGVGLLALGIAVAVREQSPLSFGGVAIGLGFLSLLLGRGPGRPPDRAAALRAHIAVMVGALIAAVTALLSVNLSDAGLPVLLLWLGPSALGVPLIVGFSRRYAPVRAPGGGGSGPPR